MIGNDKIRQAIDDCKRAGHSVGMRDLTYVLLCGQYEDIATAYRVLFGLDADFSPEYVYTYDQTSAMLYLKDYVERNLIVDTGRKKKKKLSDDEDMSFEENKAAMIKLIRDTQEAMDRGEIEPKDGLKIQADLRTRLNDKFNVAEDVRDQIVVVHQKYDDIDSAGREVARRPISKEEAMEMYNLVEKE